MREYTNQSQSGTVYNSAQNKGKTEMQIVKERVMMIAERLVKAEKEIQSLKEQLKK